ncbi:MAG: LysR family transcriptional regulator [Firmicutes bacterium]|nr:LysR family transcriptional regulator [Bacillota bacterium]
MDTFVKVIELKSFTLAASRLGLTQPGVSKQIQRLEAELGITLFHRTDGELTLTDAGRSVYQSACTLLAEWSSLQARCRQSQDPLSGELTVGASTIPSRHFLPRILANFAKAYPAVQVTVEVGDSSGIEEGLSNGNIHIALIGRKPESPALKAQCIGSDHLVIIASSDFSLTEDWRKSPFLFREQGSGTRRAAQEALAGIGVLADSLYAPFQVNDTGLILQLVRQGVGVAVVSDLDAIEAVQLGYVQVIHRFSDIRAFYVAQYRDYNLHPIEEAFLQTVHDTLSST